MPKVQKNIVARIESFRAAWRDMAPDATFASMSLAQFEEAISVPLKVRDDIVALERQLEGKKAEKQIADTAGNGLLDLVVNSVRGTPGFGPDCALYRALGYVRKSERKSGLTRKDNVSGEDATAN